MVQTITRPAEQGFETADRPIGRSIFMESELFCLDNLDVFPSRQILVDQTADPEAEVNTTVLFDAQQPQASFRWQFIEGGKNGRTVKELYVTPKETTGWVAKYDSSGRLTGTHDLGSDGLIETWQAVQAVMQSERVAEKAAEARGTKAKKEAAFEEFSKNGEVTMVIPYFSLSKKARVETIYWDRNTEKFMARVKVNLVGEALKKEAKRRREQIAKVGFSAMSLTIRPSANS